MSRSTNPPDSATRLPSEESREFYRPAHGQRINHPGVSPASPVNKQRVQVLDELRPGLAERVRRGELPERSGIVIV